MIDVSKIEYRLIAVASDGRQYDLTNICSNLGWSEQDRELAAKITFKLAVKLEEGKENITDIINICSPIFVYFKNGEEFQEVIRGNVVKFGLTESNREFTMEVEAVDEVQALRRNQEDYYFSPDSSSESILQKVLSDAGANFEIHIESVKHEKKVYRAKYLSDIVQDVLKDLKEKNHKVYFLRAKAGILEIIERGTNEQVYDFDIETNLVRVRDTFDADNLVTKVKVVAKSRDEGHQHVDSVVEGRTDLGVRQVIYMRDEKATLEDAEKSAQKILNENGIKRVTQIESADLPILRKGDRIRLKNSLGEGYFLVKSIRHDAARATMSADLLYDKEYSESQNLPIYDLAGGSETASNAP